MNARNLQFAFVSLGLTFVAAHIWLIGHNGQAGNLAQGACKSQ